MDFEAVLAFVHRGFLALASGQADESIELVTRTVPQYASDFADWFASQFASRRASQEPRPGDSSLVSSSASNIFGLHGSDSSGFDSQGEFSTDSRCGSSDDPSPAPSAIPTPGQSHATNDHSSGSDSCSPR